MKRPKEITHGCPFCESIKPPVLKIVTNDIVVKRTSERWIGNGWVYECEDCKEGFATTESDDISLANLKKVET
jgi:hypothetical protein